MSSVIEGVIPGGGLTRLKSTLHGVPTHRCGAAGVVERGGRVDRLGADRVGVLVTGRPCTENFVTPLVSLRLRCPGSRMPATA